MVVITAGASTRRTLLLAQLVSRKRDIEAVLLDDWHNSMHKSSNSEDHQKSPKIENDPDF
ncbi:MAG: hypothetical protein WBL44_02565 [Nitrososphaeraceae archaeon]|jgi:hypothetical protein